MRQWTPEDLRCKCGCVISFAIKTELIKVCQVINAGQRFFNAKWVATSGYRCPRHNARVGGVANSQHVKGQACDGYFELIGKTIAQRLIKGHAWLKTNSLVGGLGVNWKTYFIHFDTRDRVGGKIVEFKY